MLRSDLIQPLSDLIEAHAARLGNKVAFRDDRRAVGYADLAARTRRLAGHLAASGVGRGDRVAFCLGNRVETVETWLAVTRAAAVGVPVNPHSTDAELAHLLDDSGAVLVVTDPRHLDQLLRLRAGRPALRVVVTGDGPVPAGVTAWRDLADTEPGVDARDDLGLDEVAWMLYTSGTTGRPKGVLSTQRTCLWSVAACYVPIPGLTDADRVVWPLPLFHSLSHIGCVLSVTAVGATARLIDGFSADDVLRAVDEDEATVLAGVPAMYHHLVTAARETRLPRPGPAGLPGRRGDHHRRAAPGVRRGLRRAAARRVRQHGDLRLDRRHPAGPAPGRGFLRPRGARRRGAPGQPADRPGRADRRRG